ncbi:MAG TPA: PD-(D/E)XK nuclease family protein [Longimicrobiales bacterium]|nr:PD-(D/E)XK nuclease family protein [Longimicrobiales bacterium]
MQSLDPTKYAQILLSLDELAQRQRTARKIFVCGYTAEGRELLRALALAGRGWIGFEPTDAKRLANELVAHDIARDGMRIADAFDLLALLDQSIDETIARSGDGLSAEIRVLADQVGFRKAIRRSVDALRMEGIDSPSLRCAGLEDLRKRNFLADIYASYEQKLRQSKLADTAEVFRRSAYGISRGTIHLPRATIILMPGIAMHGLSGRFIDCLRSRGAIVLQDDAAGFDSPRFTLPPSSALAPSSSGRTIEIFAASSPLHEIKEVLRRCVARGLHWDEIEIVATDANVYGCALDSLARRLGIPVSYAVGLPASRTRPGRVITAYLRWIQEDFSDEIMRALLESGDIAPDGDARSASGVSLARTLRKIRIGWGRDRYLAHIDAAEQEALVESREDDSDDDAERGAELLADLTALRKLFVHVLHATPPMPDRLRRNANRISPASLANGLCAILECAVTDHDVDRIAKERIQAKLERIRATMTREMTFESALAVIRERLDIRVPAVGAAGPAPWTSSPGHVHLSSLDHGGFTGRRATFVVGLDASRFPRASGRDPLLADDDRSRISTTLPTTTERILEAQFRFVSLFARLRGELTLSYSAYDAVEGRKLSPASVVLDAFRAKTGNAHANYDDLREAIADKTATAVPSTTQGVLDGDDVWLSAMSEDGVMRSAQHVVRYAFPGLNRGLVARAMRAVREPGAQHGLVSAHGTLDPRVSGEIVSPSRLETLGTCGLRYFYRYVLKIRPPDIPEFDPEVWLDPRNRGSLLHEVFEITLTDAREHGVEVLSSEFDKIAFAQLNAACLKWRALVPPPSETVFAREIIDLKSDVTAFTNMCRADGANWVALELQFGTPETPVKLNVPGGSINVAGRVDRVDETADGKLLVIDYKTGSSFHYQEGTFEGGRRLQHYLYCIAVEQLLHKPAARMEYRFPTAKAEGHAFPFDLGALSGAPELLGAMLDNVAAGRFLPTDDRDDCGYCDFRDCCRVTRGKSETISPPAVWARSLSPVPDEYRVLVELRGRFR